MTTSLDAMLDALMPLVKPLVEHIEASTATTQHHYGDYMSAIAIVAEKSGVKDAKMYKTTCIAVGVAMQRAGGNKNGINSALRAMGCL